MPQDIWRTFAIETYGHCPKYNAGKLLKIDDAYRILNSAIYAYKKNPEKKLNKGLDLASPTDKIFLPSKA